MELTMNREIAQNYFNQEKLHINRQSIYRLIIVNLFFFILFSINVLFIHANTIEIGYGLIFLAYVVFSLVITSTKFNSFKNNYFGFFIAMMMFVIQMNLYLYIVQQHYDGFFWTLYVSMIMLQCLIFLFFFNLNINKSHLITPKKHLFKFPRSKIIGFSVFVIILTLFFFLPEQYQLPIIEIIIYVSIAGILYDASELFIKFYWAKKYKINAIIPDPIHSNEIDILP